MKKILVLISFLAVAIAQDQPVKTTKKTLLAWDHEFPASVESFKLEAWSNQGTNSVGAVTWRLSTNVTVLVFGGVVNSNTLLTEFTFPLVDLMRYQTNGVYRNFVYAVDSEGVVSDPSNPLVIFWYGRPAPPTGQRLVVRQSSTNSLPPTP